MPLALGVTSRDTWSSASARRLRKSERWTRPTVCSFRRSSAVGAWAVKRWLGVEAPETLWEVGVSAMFAKGSWRCR